MLIKNIQLKNFRQFKDTQLINFLWNDPHKNVTIIFGQNGSGKTTLSQAFTWCLYGKTDFKDKIMLSKSVDQQLYHNEKAEVEVSLTILHDNKEYCITRSQKYIKEMTEEPANPRSTKFTISYTAPDGQQCFVKENETEHTVNTILPESLSSYFFFDGERINLMSKEVTQGKGEQFAKAVKNLLGLNAYTNAIADLSGVVKELKKESNTEGDTHLDDILSELDQHEVELDKINQKRLNLGYEEHEIKNLLSEYNDKIELSKNTDKDLSERAALMKQIEDNTNIKNEKHKLFFLKLNSNGLNFFSSFLIKEALDFLSKEDILDKGIPDITATTIQHLLDKEECICGEHIITNDLKYKKLNDLLAFIPPASLGTLIKQHQTLSKEKQKHTNDFYTDIEQNVKDIRNILKHNEDMEIQIELLEEKLEGATNIEPIKIRYSDAQKELERINQTEKELMIKEAILSNRKKELDKKVEELTKAQKGNEVILNQKKYAEQLLFILKNDYAQKEKLMRQNLENQINVIFKTIYDGGLQLSLDDKYNVQVTTTEYNGYIETSTAQSISVILAFISGVISIAKEQNLDKNRDEINIITEPYPLVMDAPLSAFDTERIQTICETIPKIAEQVIIFIKDTDGNIAGKYMTNKIGKKYKFYKKNEVETYLEEVM